MPQKQDPAPQQVQQPVNPPPQSPTSQQVIATPVFPRTTPAPLVQPDQETKITLRSIILELNLYIFRDYRQIFSGLYQIERPLNRA